MSYGNALASVLSSVCFFVLALGIFAFSRRKPGPYTGPIPSPALLELPNDLSYELDHNEILAQILRSDVSLLAYFPIESRRLLLIKLLAVSGCLFLGLMTLATRSWAAIYGWGRALQ
jgi:hypothetical protein